MSEINQDEAVEATTTSIGVSRRRLAFRPQSLNVSLSQPLIGTSGERTRSGKPDRFATELAADSPCKLEPMTLSGLGSSTPEQLLTKKSIRRITTWSMNETMIFYDGLKQVFKIIHTHVSFAKIDTVVSPPPLPMYGVFTPLLPPPPPRCFSAQSPGSIAIDI